MTVIAPTELRGLVTRCPVCGRGGVDRVTLEHPSGDRSPREVTIAHHDGRECRGLMAGA